MVPFSFAGEEMRLVGGRALFWPRENALLVADLHLEKGSFFARHGQMLPPYDSRETLERLALALRHTGARRVFCLGDSFHDANAAVRLEPHAAGMLDALTRSTDWVWITGNHDSSAAGHPGGTRLDEVEVGGVVLRHAALRGEARREISGHFHPRIIVRTQGRRVARACMVASERRVIVPAFGALTGGMDAASAAIIEALQPADAIDALAAAGDRLVSFPLWRAAA